MHRFCTYCDEGYAARLLCLRDSLRATGEPFRLDVLCFDAVVEAVVRGEHDASLVAVPLAELITADPGYAAVRPSRTTYEFYFTSTPVFILHCLQREPAADRMTYLDADLYFYSAPSAVFAAQADASVAIVPHRFPAGAEHLAVHGIYNVGWVSFRRDAEGLACLDWWREQCLRWCHDYVDAGRYADQGYLDECPRRYRHVAILNDVGINAAPWNMSGVAVTQEQGGLAVAGQPLHFFHFQGIKEIVPGLFEPGFRAYSARLTSSLRDRIYVPYLRQLATRQRELEVRHGIAPRLGYHRMTTGRTWRDRWRRFKGRWWLPYYLRVRGCLISV